MVGTHDNNGYVSLATSDESIPSTSIRPITITFEGGGFLTLEVDGGITYAYGLGGLSGLLSNPYAFSCAFLASLGGLTFGYDQGVIANVLVMPLFKNMFRMSAWQVGLVTAILELGALVGALGAGFGVGERRRAILAASAIFCVGGILQCIATNVPILAIGRAIGGVGVGALSMLCPLYISEISAPEVRGSLMALEQLSIVLGVVLGFWTGYFTRAIPSAWAFRLPLAIQVIPGAFLGIGCLFLPRSPRECISNGTLPASRAALTELRAQPYEHPLIEVEILEMRVQNNLEKTARSHDDTSSSAARELKQWSQLFGPLYNDRTLVGVLMGAFQQWTGINALLYYGPTLVSALGARGGSELIISGGISIAQLVAVLPAIVYIDKLGRKTMLRGGSIVTSLAHLSIAVLIFSFSSHWTSHPVAAGFAIAFMYIFTLAYGVSFGPVTWVLPSEIFPFSMRAKGVALSTSSVWFNNFLIGVFTPPLIALSPSATFLLFSLACAAAYFWSTRYVPETAGKSLEEIDAGFSASAGTADRDKRRQEEIRLGLPKLVHEIIGIPYTRVPSRGAV